MSSKSCDVKYMGGTPGADSSEYVLYSSVTTFAAGGNLLAKTCRLFISILHGQTGSFKLEASDDGGTTWHQVFEVDPVPVVADDPSQFDLLVESHRDVKATWTNGGAAQSPWMVGISLNQDRAAA